MEPPVPPPRKKQISSKIPVLNKGYTSSDLSSPIQEDPPSFIHVAEVHSSQTHLLASSEEYDEGKKIEKKRKKIRKRSTFTVKGADDDIKVYNSDEIEEAATGSGSSKEKENLSNLSKKRVIMKRRQNDHTKDVTMSSSMGDELKHDHDDAGSKKEIGCSLNKVNDFSFKEPIPMRRRSKPQNALPTKDNCHGSATETLSDTSSDCSRKIKLGPFSANSRHRKPHGSATETLSEDSSTKSIKSVHHNSPLQPPVPLPRRSLTKSTENVLLPSSEVVSEKVYSESPRSYCTSSSLDYKDTGVIPQQRLKKHKKRRKLRDTASLKGSEEDLSFKESTKAPLHQLNREKNSPTAESDLKDDTAVCITIHGCDPLKLKDFNTQPLIRVHIMDIKMNKYRRSALGKMNIDIVQTQPYDFRYQRAAIPRWEEDLVLMEPISHIAALETLLIFELLESEGEGIIAWAFLKPVAANGAKNVGKRLRLQLYKPTKSAGPEGKDDVALKPFHWWLKKKFSNYKSTLYITMNAVPSNLIIQQQQKSIEVNVEGEAEEGNLNDGNSDSPIKLHVEDELRGVVWSRLPTLSCKIPNKAIMSLSSGPDGGMSIAYSNSGLLLACHTSHTISIFTFKGSRYLTLIGHQGIVYSLCWSKDDNYLLSSSADSTACIWDVGNKKTRPIKILPHPAYVYTACWLQPEPLVATGCYDCQVRIWGVEPDSPSQPLQLLTNHKARINSLAVLPDSDSSTERELLVSGDSNGIIIFWKTTMDRSVELSRELRLRELKGKVINCIRVHHAGKRLLVHTRDNMLRMVDISSGSIIQWFQGGHNTRLQCGSCFCGCGSRILACSEDGSILIWDAHTGEWIAFYKLLYHPNCPAMVSFHPADHMMAVVSHSAQSFPSILLLTFDRESDGKDIGLVWMDTTSADINKSQLSISSQSTKAESSSDYHDDRGSTTAATMEQTFRKKKKKELGIIKTIFGMNKKDKKGLENDGFNETENSAVPAIVSLRKGAAARYKEILSEAEMNGNEVTDHRLSDIIKRMDKILIAVTPNKPPS